MNQKEHRWKFQVGQGLFDEYRARLDEQERPLIEVRVYPEGSWVYWTGAPVAEEILRLAPGSCRWVETEEYWKTSCGRAFVLNDGTPSENEMRFCAYCGEPLEEIRTEVLE